MPQKKNAQKNQKHLQKNAQKNQKHLQKCGRYTVAPEMKEELQLIGRTIVDQPANGNCLFNAFAHQHCGDSKEHAMYRRKAAKYVDSYPNTVLESFSQDVVGMSWEDWRQKIRDQHFFGDEYVLRVLCTVFNVKVRVYRLHQDPIEFVQGFGDPTNGTKLIELSFHGDEESGHYNSVVESGMRPLQESQAHLMGEPNQPTRRALGQAGGPRGHDNDNVPNELAPWNCHLCTFANHPALSYCESCEAARL